MQNNNAYAVYIFNCDGLMAVLAIFLCAIKATQKIRQMVRRSENKRLCNCAGGGVIERYVRMRSGKESKGTQIPYRMVKYQAISHPVRNLNAGGITGASDQCTSVCAEDVCCG